MALYGNTVSLLNTFLLIKKYKLRKENIEFVSFKGSNSNLKLEMDKNFFYNSLKLGEELRIAGEFLDNGIEKLISIESPQSHELFYIIYHFSVGIERLQKVLILLSYQDVNLLKEIKHHNHLQLQKLIKNKVDLQFEKPENKLLEVLNLFYKNRYVSIEYNDEINNVLKLMKKNNFLQDSPYSYSEFGNFDKGKFKKSIITIISRYIKAIKYYEEELNVYTTETNSNSGLARFAILSEIKEINQKYENEKLAKLEILYYLVQLDKKNIEFDGLDNLPVIEIDEGLIDRYILELLNKKDDFGHLKELGAELESIYKDEMELTNAEIKNRKENLKSLPGFLYFELYYKYEL
ncbi:hypothetical protein MKZ72_03325 [Staphylococcus hominis subsp. hominis]|uniref:hypothetical protein n=1 Tax=Staphylococcus hominis TaxID=1290 RepID=UPI001F5DCCFD|nr:hypothetical protein [Staphylococcus hominis]MCI3136318.1 hypothetical protein [Staphylococcus hominis subsp. hominis]